MGYLKERGFTLIELLIVVVIIALLAAIAIPSIIDRQLSQLEPGEIVIDKIPDPAYRHWYIVVHNYKEDYVKAKRVDIRTYYKTIVEK